MFETKLIDRALDKYLPKGSKLARAMRYSVFAGGKRFRPILMLEAAKMCGGKVSSVMPAACAVEMIHTFTLIHDDLPAMDDSDLRRGKPTCHKVFGEDIAILVGDALNTWAYKVIATYCPTKYSALVANELGEGLMRVVLGQVMDLEAEGKRLNYQKLKEIHLNKTAALIEASVRMGAILSQASPAKIRALTNYARNLGLAFQITDDILDVTSSQKVLGKPPRLDQSRRKATYPSLLGLKPAQALADKHQRLAQTSLKIFGSKAKTLSMIAEFAVRRKK